MEGKAKFKVGDRVRMTKTVDGHKSDCLATIVHDDCSTTYRFAIEFDNDVDFGHDGWCSGFRGKDGRCWWVGADAIELVKPLTIEAGKFYITRDGRRVGPIRAEGVRGGLWKWNIEHPRYLDGMRAAWKVDGTFDYSNKPHPADLIAEAPAYTSNAAAQSDNLADEYGGGKKAPRFKVGDRVRLGGNSGWNEKGYVVTRVDEGKVWLSPGNGMRDVYYTNTEGWVVVKAAYQPHAIVAVIEDGQPKPATRPYVHTDRAAAKAEAERLAGVNKGKTFGVYELVDEAKVERVYDHEWQRLAAGGERLKAVKALRDIAGISLKAAVDAVDYVKAAA